ncbi:MAG: alpha/beta hydrolase [Pseudomonadota bacterium]
MTEPATSRETDPNPFATLHAFEAANGDRVRFREVGPKDGPWVLLIHGHTQTSLLWEPLAHRLARDGYHVIAPNIAVQRREEDAAPLSKKEIAGRFDELLEARGCGSATGVVVGHDLGAMIAYAYAAAHRDRLRALAMLEATPPGIGFWPQLLTDPRVWHFHFHGPFAERLVRGREEIYLARFWTEFSGAQADVVKEPFRADYISALREDGALGRAFDQFRAFRQDCEDNLKSADEPLDVPVLAVGGALSFGPIIGEQMAQVARDVRAVVIGGAGHWLIEENYGETEAVLRDFIEIQLPLPGGATRQAAESTLSPTSPNQGKKIT